MLIEFSDKNLHALASGAVNDPAYSVGLIKSYQNKIVMLHAAPDERTLRNLKSLHFEKLKGDRKHQHSIRLNDKWRLILQLDDATLTKTIKIVAIEDYH
jgi:proteic killer suppression protein